MPAVPASHDTPRLHAAARGMAGRRVLLVDDQPDRLELTVELLRAAGVEVRAAADGEQALRHLRADRVDAVLLDCRMPTLDGFETARQIRALPGGQQLPIVAVSASLLADDRDRALLAGMNAYLTKPIDIDQLFDTLADLFARAPAPPGRATAVLAPPPLRSLPGIDASGALARLGGDRRYRRLLAEFRDRHAPFAAQFRSALGRGDRAGAADLARALAARCATLGVYGVEDAARHLASAVERGAHPGTVDGLLDELDAQLGPIVDTLATLG